MIYATWDNNASLKNHLTKPSAPGMRNHLSSGSGKPKSVPKLNKLLLLPLVASQKLKIIPIAKHISQFDKGDHGKYSKI